MEEGPIVIFVLLVGISQILILLGLAHNAPRRVPLLTKALPLLAIVTTMDVQLVHINQLVLPVALPVHLVLPLMLERRVVTHFPLILQH